MAAVKAFLVTVRLFACFSVSFASDDSCLSDIQSTQAGPEEATKCQALLQSGLQQVASSMVDVDAEETDFEAQEPKTAEKGKGKGKADAKKPEGKKEPEENPVPVLAEDEVESKLTGKVTKKESKPPGGDYFKVDYPFDDPEAQRIPQVAVGKDDHDKSWATDLVHDENMGKPNYLEALNKKPMPARPAPVTAPKPMVAPKEEAKKVITHKEEAKDKGKPVPASAVAGKQAPMPAKAKAPAKGPTPPSAPKEIVKNLKDEVKEEKIEPIAKPEEKAKAPSEDTGPIRIYRAMQAEDAAALQEG